MFDYVFTVYEFSYYLRNEKDYKTKRFEKGPKEYHIISSENDETLVDDLWYYEEKMRKIWKGCKHCRKRYQLLRNLIWHIEYILEYEEDPNPKHLTNREFYDLLWQNNNKESYNTISHMGVFEEKRSYEKRENLLSLVSNCKHVYFYCRERMLDILLGLNDDNNHSSLFRFCKNRLYDENLLYIIRDFLITSSKQIEHDKISEYLPSEEDEDCEEGENSDETVEVDIDYT